MRLLRRNALSAYSVYVAAIFSGLLVTPILIHSIGKTAFGVWSFIGAVTIYLSVLDLGVGPSIVRFGAEARGRGSVEDLNAIVSTGLAIYGVIALVTVPVGLALAWIVPIAVGAPHALTWDARICTLLVVLSFVLRFPLGLFNNVLVAYQRSDLQNLGNLVSTIVYAVLVAALIPHWGGLVLIGGLTLLATVLRLALPLIGLRREVPNLRLARRLVTRARLRELVFFSSSNFLVHVAHKIVFSTDVVVVGIVLGSSLAGVYGVAAKLFALVFGIGTAATTLMFPAFAELEGAGASERQRNLLLTGLRAGMVLMLILALPLLLIPDQLIHAWIGSGFHGSYSVMAILAVVLVLHSPIYVLTQFLIARAKQRVAAVVSLATTLVNLLLSFAAAATIGLWGVALSTLVTDLIAFCWIVLWIAAPAASTSRIMLMRAITRPVLPGLLAAAVVLIGVARVWNPTTLAALVPIGALWTVVGGWAMWRFGFARAERVRFMQELRRPRAAAVAADV